MPLWPRNPQRLHPLLATLCGLLLMLVPVSLSAQTVGVTIGGNVYGGGNRGNLNGSTNVLINDGVILGDMAFNGSLPGAVAAGNPIVPGVKFTQAEIDAAAEGDPAYGKTTDDWKIAPSAETYSEKSAAVYNSKLYMARGGGVFGGARMADVGGSSTVTINDGFVLNVYGGNDVSGAVAGGTNVNIFSTVIGDVFGGGNGSYIYCDVPLTDGEDGTKKVLHDQLVALGYNEEQITYVTNLQDDALYTVAPGEESVDALNDKRPSAPSTKILLQGTESKNVFVNGGVYCGGNSATLRTATRATPTAELTLGRYVAANNIFMGCNGENLVSASTLNNLASPYLNISTVDLTNSATMAKYMSAVEMSIPVTLKFTDDYPATLTNNILETAHIGNFFCGGNVGSMSKSGYQEFHFSKAVYIHQKLVGGCNNAKVPYVAGRNAEFLGGILGTSGTADGTPDTKVWLRLSGTYLEPRRLAFDVDTRSFTFDWYMSDGDGDPETDDGSLKWGNVYGGCFSSGKVNGGVRIDVNSSTVNYDDIFGTGTGSHGLAKSGVNKYNQSQDVFCKALSIFGGGYGTATSIEGNTTINITDGGVAFQVFGGGEKGDINGNTTVNLTGGRVNELYGGGFAGNVNGHSRVNLMGGWFFDAFGGACNADVRDYTEVFVGSQDGASYPTGSNLYGGNDFGGRVGVTEAEGYTSKTHSGYTYDASTHAITPADVASDTYVEYWHGQVDSIAGGSYGDYDYEVKYTRIASELTSIDPVNYPVGYNYSKPKVNKSFLNIRTDAIHNTDKVKYFIGGSEGASGEATNDKMQHDTYVLVDAPGLQMTNANVYGGGAHAGLRGGSTEIHLVQGTVHNVFGASLNEGGTEHAHVIVPDGSTIHVNAIFGGADGGIVKEPEESYEDYADRKAEFDSNINKIPCDTKYAIVDYHSEDATVEEAIYGGNNFQRRTVYSTLNINVPVRNLAGSLIDVFGAGLGGNSWGCCTKVYLEDGAQVKNVYGGGSNGRVFESLSEWERLMVEYRSNYDRYDRDNNCPNPSAYYSDIPIIHQSLDDPKQYDKFTDPAYYSSTEDLGHYLDNLPHVELQAGTPVANPRFEEFCTKMCLDPVAVRTAYNNKWSWGANDHNTNVFIRTGATVMGNAFGGGKGSQASVAGRTSITLDGGEVKGNIYGGGEEGFIADRYLLGMDKVNVQINGGPWPYTDPEQGGATVYLSDESINDTIASTRVFIKGGKVHYVYGGGLAGHIGCRVGGWDDRTLQTYPGPSLYGIIPAPTYVVVGNRDQEGATYHDGLPTITRSVFGGGEKGRVVGTAHLFINNGYIGYRYNEATGEFEENTIGEDGAILAENGNAFGAGYGEGALVYHTRVNMYGGVIRNSLYGGGEIAAVGHGTTMEVAGSSVRTLEGIRYAGDTRIEMFDGHVRRDVFGGGRGYSYDRTGNEVVGNQLYTDGYVFGQTTVHIHGGEVGTAEGIAQGYGNVFGGGNIGYVYSGFGTANRTKDTGSPNHYYYYSNQDTYVCSSAYFNGVTDFRTGDAISVSDYNQLSASDKTHWSIRTAGHLTEDCAVLVEPHAKVLKTWKDFTNGDTATPVTTVTINGHTYSPNDYVPTDDLNTLKSKDDVSSVGMLEPGDSGYDDAAQLSDKATWLKLDDKGIIIHNGVFGGGDVAIGSDKVFANATTVHGNVTASVRDIYSRDFITIGTEHVGGLYGGGNLSLVNGYRELHIENYGTDYYSLQQVIPIEDYRTKLSDREKAYFRLRFIALQNIPAVTVNGVTFPSIPKDTPIFEEDYNDLPEAQKDPNYWQIDGVCNLYAGRLLNSIQRADFVGMYGSRLVLQGAMDRVTDVVDYTRYTINRVGELSLNKETAPFGGSAHGNYFGIYSVVNHLGNLTSDVFFEEDMTVTNGEKVKKTDAPVTYYSFYDYKYDNRNKRKRNDGTCHNQVALASGVFLELTTEHSTEDVKDYGYITGIVELDLINAKADNVGGGYVYAKNEHRIRKYFPNRENVTLSLHNADARTHKRYIYDPSDPDVSSMSSAEKVGATVSTGVEADWGDYREIQTSGNFIHDANKKIIIDDCYPNNAEYHPLEPNYSTAHYWYVKGAIYIYDQVISAYTGTATAYLKEVKIPLTITAGSHGKLKLINVKPSRYAYNNALSTRMDENGQTVNNGSQTYYLNDVIDYWTWSQLSSEEKLYFVPETKVSVANYKLSDAESAPLNPLGTVLSESDYSYFKTSNACPLQTINGVANVRALYNADTGEWVAADDIFHSSNNMSHETGYVLTFEMDSPSDWNNMYTPKQGSDTSILKTDWEALPATGGGDSQDDYLSGPTFSPDYTGNTPVAYGQREYELGEIIPKEVHDNYPYSESEATALGNQAKVTICYAAKEPITTSSSTINMGAPISQSRYLELVASGVEDSKFEQALLCTETIQLSDDSYLFNGEVVTSGERDAMKATYIVTYKDNYLKRYMLNNNLDPLNAADVTTAKTATGYDGGALATEASDDADEVFGKCLSLAYYCERAGLYGGKLYDKNVNYEALDSWCSLSNADREQFTFNDDAFDLLRNSLFPNNMSGFLSPYCDTKYVEYTATYTGDADIPISASVTVTRGGTATSTSTIQTGDVMNRVDYETYISNEQYHFAPITVNKSDEAEDYFIVNTDFVHDDRPYTVGQTISAATYVTLSDTDRSKVTRQSINYNYFKGDGNPDYVILFYCTEAFSRGTGVTSISGVNIGTGAASGTYAANSNVTKGTFINATEYAKLPNQQRNFLIKGQEPTESTTLYVSRESEIEDLSKERIYTVIYQYTYNESDDADNVELANELHIINIHVQFESGVPTIGQLLPPATVLPGSTVGLKQPSVTKGAYEIMGGGWEIFDNHTDALSHHNGAAFENNGTKVYWYQNHYENEGKHYGYWVAYYAMTRAGKTFSNPVPLSVANYHDLANLMADKEHHLYVDHTGVQRESKVYINDYSASSKNGLDLMKQFYDLSLLTSSDVNTDANGLITTIKDNAEPPADPVDSPFKGHALINNHVRAGENLEFFMRTDLSATADASAPSGFAAWNSIGTTSATCFAGTLHGDGHTISGLSSSLFNYLCGDVYNLGVTGSFTGAGIAETGSGYVENCWVKTSATPADTKAVFGNPSRDSGTQVVNCYYPASNAYSETVNPRGNALKMTDREFYNGTVAYNLNGFYLKERFDRNRTVGGSSAEAIGDTYVANRFADGDFIYSNGVIPTKDDIRKQSDGTYAPRWPDDYLYFGQRLTYGYNPERPHQSQPDSLYKMFVDDGVHAPYHRLPENDWANHIYRAPAYYRSKVMGVYHYNPFCNLAGHSADGTKEAYPDMTATDFSGYNDVFKDESGTAVLQPYRIGYYKTEDGEGKRTDQYQGLGLETYGAFYPPLLDDGGLIGIRNRDFTHNLLQYAPYVSLDALSGEPDETNTPAVIKTHNVVINTTTDPVFDYSYSGDYDDYKTVAVVNSGSVRAHSVERTGPTSTEYIAHRDQLLVDNQDFNCPIEYYFDSDHRMWHQRTPSLFAGQKKVGSTVTFVDGAGWESISLPFTAELVTTQQKGELTHFYATSATGHEYWLRKFRSMMPNDETPPTELTANFTAPNSVLDGSAVNKVVTNDFLWDYYYSQSSRQDANTDEYKQYYKQDDVSGIVNTFENYPCLAAATPYLIGFPGERYYEFDLSGKFVPENTYASIEKLDPQVITFVSPKGVTINVSDDELAAARSGASNGGYTFVPSYMYESIEAGENTYTAKADGSGYDKVPASGAATQVAPFRPYFTVTPSLVKGVTRSIIFSNVPEQLYGEKQPEPDADSLNGYLDIRARGRNILVTSHLDAETTVYVYSASGATIAAFNIEPGKTIKTPVHNAGIYLVRSTHNTTSPSDKNIKKLSIK